MVHRASQAFDHALQLMQNMRTGTQRLHSGQLQRLLGIQGLQLTVAAAVAGSGACSGWSTQRHVAGEAHPCNRLQQRDVGHGEAVHTEQLLLGGHGGPVHCCCCTAVGYLLHQLGGSGLQ